MGTFDCRLIGSSQIASYGQDAPLCPYYLTIDAIEPISSFILPKFTCSPGSAYQVAVPSGSAPAYWVYENAEITPNEGSPYFRASLAEMPIPVHSAGGPFLTFSGGQLVTIPLTGLLPAGNSPWSICLRAKFPTGISGILIELGDFHRNCLNTNVSGSVKAQTGSGDVDTAQVVCGSAWRSLIAIWDGSLLEIFLDGVSSNAIFLAANSTAYNTIDGRLGVEDNGTSGFLTGQLIDVRVYDVILDADQVVGIANLPANTPVGSPLNWWRCDEGSGSTLIDSGTIGNSLTFPGGGADPTWTP